MEVAVTETTVVQEEKKTDQVEAVEAEAVTVAVTESAVVVEEKKIEQEDSVVAAAVEAAVQVAVEQVTSASVGILF